MILGIRINLAVNSNEAIRVLLACDRLGQDAEGLHGGGRSFLNITKGLRKRGVAVIPVVLRGSDIFRSLVESEKIPVVFLDRNRFDPRTLIDFTALIWKNSVQIAHLQNHGASTFGRLAAILSGIPTIVHVHDDHRYPPGNYPWYAHLINRILARSTRCVLAVSGAIGQAAMETHGFKPDQVQVFHNPVERQCFREPSAKQKEQARVNLGLSPDSSVAVCIGRIEYHEKGSDILIEAWKDVHAALPSSELVIAGEGPLRRPLEEKIRAESWSHRVHFLGFRNDVELLLWAADVLVIPSRREGLGNIILEAMSTGLPVIGTRAGGIPEIVRHAENGLLVAPEDPQALSRTIISFFSDKSLQANLRCGAKRAAEKCDLSSFAERLETLYRRLI
jgi:glycosyltransferase involved in cell wall biosynthesis